MFLLFSEGTDDATYIRLLRRDPRLRPLGRCTDPAYARPSREDEWALPGAGSGALDERPPPSSSGASAGVRLSDWLGLLAPSGPQAVPQLCLVQMAHAP